MEEQQFFCRFVNCFSFLICVLDKHYANLSVLVCLKAGNWQISRKNILDKHIFRGLTFAWVVQPVLFMFFFLYILSGRQTGVSVGAEQFVKIVYCHFFFNGS